MTLLIDSGASDSIISPKIAQKFPDIIFHEPFEVTACKKVYKENLILALTPTKRIRNKQNFPLSFFKLAQYIRRSNRLQGPPKFEYNY